MFGTETKQSDERIYKIVNELYFKYKRNWEQYLQNEFNKPLTIKFTRNIPYSDIVDARTYFGKKSDHIGVFTDTGEVKLNKTDGGVIYVEIQDGDTSVKLPIVWVETKSSNSCTTNKGTRGQATGLIAEQAQRTTQWVSIIDKKVKPLVSIMMGTDFNEKRGIYNIDRIRMDLETKGNIDPYEEGLDGVSWFYFQENFTNIELKNLIFNSIKINLEKMKEVLMTL